MWFPCTKFTGQAISCVITQHIHNHNLLSTRLNWKAFESGLEWSNGIAKRNSQTEWSKWTVLGSQWLVAIESKLGLLLIIIDKTSAECIAGNKCAFLWCDQKYWTFPDSIWRIVLCKEMSGARLVPLTKPSMSYAPQAKSFQFGALFLALNSNIKALDTLDEEFRLLIVDMRNFCINLNSIIAHNRR